MAGIVHAQPRDVGMPPRPLTPHGRSAGRQVGVWSGPRAASSSRSSSLTCSLHWVLLIGLPWAAFLAHPSATIAAAPTEPSASAARQPKAVTLTHAGRFVTCLARGPHGALWIGAEESGLARLRGNELTRFCTEVKAADEAPGEQKPETADDAPPETEPALEVKTCAGLVDDSPYCIAPDADGGVWVGNRSRGASYFDGKTWTHYGVADGLGGTRVFGIAVDAATRCTWFATEHGVTRFDGRSWQAFYACDGLPAGGISSLALDGTGQLWAAGACGGLSCFDGATWHQSEHDAILADVRINDMLFTQDGTLWVASTEGIHSRPALVEAKPTRGTKLLGKLFGREKEQPVWTHHVPMQVLPRRVREDFITCLAEDANGTLLFGTRKSGILVFNRARNTWGLLGKAHGLADTYISAILPLGSGTRLFGTYGYGLSIFGKNATALLPPSSAPAEPTTVRTELSRVPSGDPASERSRRLNEGVQREARLLLVGGHGGEKPNAIKFL